VSVVLGSRGHHVECGQGRAQCRACCQTEEHAPPTSSREHDAIVAQSPNVPTRGRFPESKYKSQFGHAQIALRLALAQSAFDSARTEQFEPAQEGSTHLHPGGQLGPRERAAWKGRQVADC
jgi:hypothetical protein